MLSDNKKKIKISDIAHEASENNSVYAEEE